MSGTVLLSVDVYAGLDASARAVAVSAAQRISSLQRKMIADVVEIGQALLQAKSVLGHGNFLPWLKSECELSERTAQNFMAVAENLGAKSATVAHLPLATVYRLASSPPTVRDSIVARLDSEVVEPAEIDAEITVAKREEARQREREKALAKKSPDARAKAKAAEARRKRAIEAHQEEWADERRRREDAQRAAAMLIAECVGQRMPELVEQMRLAGSLSCAALVEAWS